MISILIHGRQSLPAFSLITVLMLGTGAAAQGTVRILPVGDSVTDSTAPYSSYRERLFAGLADRRVDFVGPRQGVASGGAPLHRFDQDHLGTWGIRASTVLTFLNLYSAPPPPELRADFALIHLGGNDLWQDHNAGVPLATSVANAMAALDGIVCKLTQLNPGITVLVAQLFPALGLPKLDNAIVALNAQIATWPWTCANVTIVDQYTGIVDNDTYDGIHPNASGDQKIADNWLAVLTGLIPAQGASAAFTREFGYACDPPAGGIMQRHLEAIGLPTVGNPSFALTTTNITGSAVLAVGAEYNPPISLNDALGCVQLASDSIAVVTITGGVPIPFPISSGTPIGTRYYVQAAILTPQNELRPTNAIEIVVGL